MHASDLDPRVAAIARAIAAAGGRAYLVGGFVRDALLGRAGKDLDIEVHHLPLDRLEQVLRAAGEVISVGRAFGVLRVKGLDVDFSLPREDSKRGAGHRGFLVRCDPDLGLERAARRRDLTINSMALDMLSGEIIDHHGGRADLERGVLRATDPASFAEDPLRGVRVAQFAARFEMLPDAQLIDLCRQLDLAELPGERMLEELRKLLLKGRRPSLGLRVLEQTGLIRFFPEIAALRGVPQEPEWHPEGDVWVHTLMVVDEAAQLRDGGADDEALMFGALCHDLGKPLTTEVIDGRVRSLGHDTGGVAPTRELLQRLRAPHQLTDQVAALVEHHLAPALLDKGGATLRAFRRLARRLGEAHTTMDLLERVARADHLGRTTADALARSFPAGDRFRAIARDLAVDRAAPSDVVLGRHLIARGMAPGKAFGEVLRRCRDVQDETGLDDPDAILARVL